MANYSNVTRSNLRKYTPPPSDRLREARAIIRRDIEYLSYLLDNNHIEEAIMEVKRMSHKMDTLGNRS